jgi:hypothetical protein
VHHECRSGLRSVHALQIFAKMQSLMWTFMLFLLV